jgi:hypothetical protein
MSAGSSWLVVREVISSTASGADVMSALPGLVRRLLDEEAWRKFTPIGGGDPVRHDTFTSFITSPPPKGLGGRSAQLVALCGADAPTRSRVERLLKGEIEPARPHGTNRHSARERTTLSSSETSERHIARLKRDDPDLAVKVVNGELSAYAAARAKGWKPPRIQVTTPDRTAMHLRKHMTTDQLQELARLLAEER